jgi:hypothetical protein
MSRADKGGGYDENMRDGADQELKQQVFRFYWTLTVLS